MSTAANTLPSDSQPVPAKKRRKSIKPPNVQAAILAKYSMGESKTKIAKDLQISRTTVWELLKADETERIVLEGRSRAIGYIHKSLDVIENRLNKNDGSVAISLLRGTQVLNNQPVTVNQNNYQANTWITMKAQLAGERELEPIVVNASTEPGDNPTQKSEL
jgi:hypothetical protein